jgi:hypothetical protein
MRSVKPIIVKNPAGPRTASEHRANRNIPISTSQPTEFSYPVKSESAPVWILDVKPNRSHYAH